MIIRIIKKILHRRILRTNASFFCYGSESILTQSFKLRFDNPIKGRKYLEIGNNSIIGGTFIFESGEGKITIGDHSYIGNSVFISRSSIIISNNVTIAWGCTFYDHDSHSIDYLHRRKDIDEELQDLWAKKNFIENKDWNNVKSKPIYVCDDAWIGMNCIILKGVTIGEGAIVGAGSVVTRDVPPWTLVAGNPARIIKEIPH